MTQTRHPFNLAFPNQFITFDSCQFLHYCNTSQPYFRHNFFSILTAVHLRCAIICSQPIHLGQNKVFCVFCRLWKGHTCFYLVTQSFLSSLRRPSTASSWYKMQLQGFQLFPFHWVIILHSLACLFSPGALEFPIWIQDFTYNVTRFRHIITFYVVPFESDSSLGACGSVCIKNFFSVNPWLVKTSPYFIVEACNSSFFSHLLQLVGLFLSMLSILCSSNFAVLHIQD